MKIKTILGMMAVVVLALGVGNLRAQDKKVTDQASQSEKAARVFSEIMGTPDKGVPKELLETAKCVAVFPNVIKAGFIVGGRGGRGVASCRTGSNWSSPAFFNLGGGSIGLQIGAQSTDFVLLFMGSDGM